jgi:hypothetical protein
MKSAAQMSLEIRAKKKKMQDDPNVIDSGGSPSMDLQDEVISDRDDMTKALGLDKNDPKEKADLDQPHPSMAEETRDEHDPKPEDHAPVLSEDEMDDTQEMAMGGSIGGRGAIAGGTPPAKTGLMKVLKMADGGEVSDDTDPESADSDSWDNSNKGLNDMIDQDTDKEDPTTDPNKAKRMARLRMGRR